MKDEPEHAALVDRWLAGAADGLSEAQRLLLFEKALGALWRRGNVTLGAIMLGAVVERVLYYATEKYPFLAPLRVEADGVHFEGLSASMDPKGKRVTDAFRFVLVETLSVLGKITDEIITPSLHSGIFKVSLGDVERTLPQPPSLTDDEGEGPTR